ncbi:hypothetical protein CAEBREN_05908 [Caenorhabditis brenneri]|uniref:Uncharacterized protein n=1 Tax=Caenorhabditis brenneri TaxID=135651 RepID=G0NJ59_CAEBE|nr:hypothetical protein CAEBREN_05908 [Caenorhabditis brenneri]
MRKLSEKDFPTCAKCYPHGECLSYENQTVFCSYRVPITQNQPIFEHIGTSTSPAAVVPSSDCSYILPMLIVFTIGFFVGCAFGGVVVEKYWRRKRRFAPSYFSDSTSSQDNIFAVDRGFTRVIRHMEYRPKFLTPSSLDSAEIPKNPAFDNLSEITKNIKTLALDLNKKTDAVFDKYREMRREPKVNDETPILLSKTEETQAKYHLFSYDNDDDYSTKRRVNQFYGINLEDDSKPCSSGAKSMWNTTPPPLDEKDSAADAKDSSTDEKELFSE